jgi:hypothetical protein
MTPFTIFRTIVMWLAGAAFVKVLDGHPVGILAFGFASIGSLVWLAYDMHMLAVAGARYLGAQ